MAAATPHELLAGIWVIIPEPGATVPADDRPASRAGMLKVVMVRDSFPVSYESFTHSVPLF